MFLQQTDHVVLRDNDRRGTHLCHGTSVFQVVHCVSLDFVFQVKDLAAVSLKQPVRIFVNSNTDVAPFLRQEFVRIRPNKEGDREAVVAGRYSQHYQR